jgi:hypothetical protein
MVACSENLFGSSGNSDCGSDIKCLRMDAENAFRSGEYTKAYIAYSQIVNLDPTASVGYFGMAKAGLWMNGINPFSMFAQVSTGKDSIAFMNDLPVDQNRFYQGMRFISPALHELEHRDSMTLHYDYYVRDINGTIKKDTVFARTMDSVSWVRAVEANDFDISKITVIDNGEGQNKTYEIPLSEKLKKFIDTYNCNAGVCSKVPLSDREFSYGTYTLGLLITTVSETILRSLDTNGDGCIAKRCPEGETDCRKYNPGARENLLLWRIWGCDIQDKYSYDLSINLTVNENGDFEVDLNQLLEDLDLDAFYADQWNNPKTPLPDEISSFNDKMDEFNESIYDLMSVMGGFRDKNNSDVPLGLEGDMGAYKDFSKFYKVGTHIDEDGDGCIGEDLMDGQDNDGDGLVNSNARLTSVDPDDQYFGDDGKMMGYHGMTGNKDDDKPIRIKVSDPAFKPIANNPERTRFADLNPDEEGYVTVIKFTQRADYWTSDNREDKLRVAQDTMCPPKISLEQRRRLIGGCWSNYNEDKFVKYWLKRELARDEDRDRRVHISCKNCTGTGCLR